MFGISAGHRVDKIEMLFVIVEQCLHKAKEAEGAQEVGRRHSCDR